MHKYSWFSHFLALFSGVRNETCGQVISCSCLELLCVVDIVLMNGQLYILLGSQYPLLLAPGWTHFIPCSKIQWGSDLRGMILMSAFLRL